MRSYRLEGTCGTKCLVMRDEAQPTPKPHEIVVRVRATSLNRRDTMILNGTYPLAPRQGVIPLSDGAGEVVAVGEAVTRFAVGDRVTGSYFARWIDGRINAGLIDQLGCTLDGMLAEYAVLDEQWAVRLPDHLDWHQAATLTCAGLTAWNAVTAAEMPKPGQWVLVIGSGGVALFALQFAKLLGCRVVAVSSRNEKLDRLQALGADLVVSTADMPEWGAAMREQTGGIDLVVETGGPPTFAQSMIACALYGRIVLLTIQDAKGGTVQIPGPVYQRSLATISRLFVGNRTNLEAMLRAISVHRLKPVIDKVFAFDEANDAYRYFQQGDVFGKVVVDSA
ncbi:NAD(P)-dependent alcohol dehydrogenase [Mesorhizobium sp. M0902]|uniref:zinc-dependent alcohol dehydrogenase family protein n=1 Tax=unclassified Mesorhizobium TaxID=325217 RepID=UPI00333B1820